ncbi:hypothetical protein L1887_42335 [Cichorium endivia]|nr:hypothetical protein L1887_42335 [Cichorium endivia]
MLEQPCTDNYGLPPARHRQGCNEAPSKCLFGLSSYAGSRSKFLAARSRHQRNLGRADTPLTQTCIATIITLAAVIPSQPRLQPHQPLLPPPSSSAIPQPTSQPITPTPATLTLASVPPHTSRPPTHGHARPAFLACLPAHRQSHSHQPIVASSAVSLRAARPPARPRA